MVLEVVSKTSVRKDTVVLPQLYWKSKIPEYWLVDGRPGSPSRSRSSSAAKRATSRPPRKTAGFAPALWPRVLPEQARPPRQTPLPRSYPLKRGAGRLACRFRRIDLRSARFGRRGRLPHKMPLSHGQHHAHPPPRHPLPPLAAYAHAHEPYAAAHQVLGCDREHAAIVDAKGKVIWRSRSSSPAP